MTDPISLGSHNSHNSTNCGWAAIGQCPYCDNERLEREIEQLRSGRAITQALAELTEAKDESRRLRESRDFYRDWNLRYSCNRPHDGKPCVSPLCPMHGAANRLQVENNRLRASLNRLSAACYIEHSGINYEGECPICIALRDTDLDMARSIDL